MSEPVQSSNRRGRPAGLARPAFTLIEILIVVVILGILASIVIPQFSNAAHVARENTLKDELRYLRTQLVVFKAQHRDVAPGYPAGNPHATPTWNDLQAHMTQYSNDRCVTSVAGSQAFPLGPYLQRVPANPLTSVSKFFMVPNGQPMPTTYQGTDYGWIYKAETQEIVANSADKDANGVPYIKY